MACPLFWSPLHLGTGPSVSPSPARPSQAVPAQLSPALQPKVSMTSHSPRPHELTDQGRHPRPKTETLNHQKTPKNLAAVSRKLFGLRNQSHRYSIFGEMYVLEEKKSTYVKTDTWKEHGRQDIGFMPLSTSRFLITKTVNVSTMPNSPLRSEVHIK